MKTTIDYTLKTLVNRETESIMCELVKNQETVSKWVMDTREQLIREALIRLGWTPPVICKWWCESHEREATHVNKKGEHECDPQLGGILLCCKVIPVKSPEPI